MKKAVFKNGAFNVQTLKAHRIKALHERLDGFKDSNVMKEISKY
jgi:hypothetical protein